MESQRSKHSTKKPVGKKPKLDDPIANNNNNAVTATTHALETTNQPPPPPSSKDQTPSPSLPQDEPPSQIKGEIATTISNRNDVAASFNVGATTFKTNGALPSQPSASPTLINPDMGSPTHTDANERKRKAAAPTVSLLVFIQALVDLSRDIIVTIKSKQIKFPHEIETYVSFEGGVVLSANSKRMRMDTEKLLNGDGSDVKIGLDSFPLEFKKKTTNLILNKLYGFFEEKSIQFQFPKEMLRYFLATHLRFLDANDFVASNSITKTEKDKDKEKEKDRRAKNVSQLTNGSILYEFCKGFDIFVSNLTRCDTSDIRALKMIVEKQIAIPHQIYNIINEFVFEPPMYTTDTKMEVRPDHTQILIANNKQMYVLITPDIILYYDGNQFVVPQANFEREFTVHMKHSEKLTSDDYILLDVLVSTKIRVLDVLKFRNGTNETLSENYSDRLALIQSLLPNMTIATAQLNQSSDVSYIQKPNVGFGPSYIYHKSNLIAAVIGVSEKTVVLAFIEDSNTLVVKSKVSISGAASCAVYVKACETTPVSDLSANAQTIFLRDTKYTIVGDLTNVHLFQSAIVVELRDGNRLGALSMKPVSKVSEFKPLTMKRETAMLINDVNKRLSSPEFMLDLVRQMTKSSASITDDVRKILNSWLNPDVGISFDGYNQM